MSETDLADLERRATIAKLRAEEAKLQAERAKLAADERVASTQLEAPNQRREDLKAFSGLGAILTGLAAAIALSVSAYQWSVQQRQQHADAETNRLQQGLVLASDASPTGAEKRLIGVTLLASFIDPKTDAANRNRALIALTNLLALENDRTVRGAILEEIRGAHLDAVGKPALQQMLASLVAKSRILSRSTADESDPSFSRFSAGNDPEPKARDVGEAIAAVIRNGARGADLSGIYCAGCDFSHEDLSQNVFDDAVLTGASFEGADLKEAKFRRSRLDRVNFRNAHLETSSFHIDDDDESRMADREARRLSDMRPMVEWPDFTCAHLEHADLRGLTLFAEYPSVEGLGYQVGAPSFANANLTGTDFRDAALLVLKQYPWKSPVQYVRGYDKRISLKRHVLHIGRLIVHPTDRRILEPSFRQHAINIAIAFQGSNWREADMPAVIRQLLGWTTIPSSVGNTGCATQ